MAEGSVGTVCERDGGVDMIDVPLVESVTAGWKRHIARTLPRQSRAAGRCG